jgi:hypothetical protein
MRKKPYPITDITGGLNVTIDSVYLTDKESPNIKLCRFEGGVLYKDFGKKTFGKKVLGVPLLITHFVKSSGDTYLMLLTTTSAYRWSTSENDWVEITPNTDVYSTAKTWTVSS